MPWRQKTIWNWHLKNHLAMKGQKAWECLKSLFSCALVLPLVFMQPFSASQCFFRFLLDRLSCRKRETARCLSQVKHCDYVQELALSLLYYLEIGRNHHQKSKETWTNKTDKITAKKVKISWTPVNNAPITVKPEGGGIGLPTGFWL